MSKKPITGEPIHLPVRKKAVFHIGKELREDINRDYEADLVPEATALRMKRLQSPYENFHGIAEPVSAAK